MYCRPALVTQINGDFSMKKTLLAAALFAGFAGVAQAETQVTLYGILDTSLEVANIKTPSGASRTATGLTPATMSGNRWGMKGTEDIGGGTPYRTRWAGPTTAPGSSRNAEP
jgi:predicted porin